MALPAVGALLFSSETTEESFRACTCALMWGGAQRVFPRLVEGHVELFIRCPSYIRNVLRFLTAAKKKKLKRERG